MVTDNGAATYTIPFEQLYGALELARLLGHWRLARHIETHIDAFRPVLDAD